MAFPVAEVAVLLAACKRRCRICHRFCGVKMELDHMQPRDDGGTDEIENAIPVCFECHAEIHSYNPRHPRGRKFRPDELRLHKEQWLSVCRERPEILVHAPREIHVGPLQALIDELQYNRRVVQRASEWFKVDRQPTHRSAAPLIDEQFRRAMAAGAISVLDDELNALIIDTYASIGRAKLLSEANAHQNTDDSMHGAVGGQLRECIPSLVKPIEDTLARLLTFLGNET
jgi:hypothetical protein